MNKLEVGMWVRDINGNIGKIIYYCNDPDDYYFNCYETNIKKNTYDNRFISEYDIGIKASFDIIDLIEIGDYVNGQRVNYINKNGKYFNISFGSIDYNLKSKFNGDIKWLSVDEIKSIVTKEQFEEMKYEVKL